jgi:hypothetical protein
MKDDAYCLRNVIFIYQTTHSKGTANPKAEISVRLYEINLRQVTVKFKKTASSETSIFLYQTMQGPGAVNIETAGFTEILISIYQK